MKKNGFFLLFISSFVDKYQSVVAEPINKQPERINEESL